MSAAPADRTAPTFDTAFSERLQTLCLWRRDVRHFQRKPWPEGVFKKLLDIASLAPSVGLSEPWRFVAVDNPDTRQAIRACFEACNASALAAQDESRASLYARLKLSGLDDAPQHFAVFAEPEPSQGHGLGRATMPDTTAYSAVLAVHTLWLAARTMNLGLGWVSILDPQAVARILDVAPEWKFIGYFCLGYPVAESDTPELHRLGWEQRAPSGRTFVQR